MAQNRVRHPVIVPFKLLFAVRLSPWSQALFRLYGVLRPLAYPPIFVIGNNRSGTGVFTHYLSRSRDIVNWSEANEMWDPVGYPWQANRVVRPFWPIDPQGYTNSVLASLGQTYLEAIPGMCSMYVATHRGVFNRARFVNKSPMNTLRVDLIRRLFPNACFISIVRDPRAVVRSWVEKIRPKLDKHPYSGVETKEGITVFIINGVKYNRHELLEGLSKSWCYIVRRQMEQLGKFERERKFYIRYEDFVSNLHSVLRDVDRKFGLDSEKRHWSRIPETLESRNIKFREEFTAAEIDLIVRECGTVMEQFGYQKDSV
jgi:hypothetical protein